MTPQPPTRTSWLWWCRGLLLDTTSQKPGTHSWERVEEVALGIDDGKPREAAVSTGCSEVLPALLHTQGREPKPGLDLVALTPAWAVP